jgi:hypothetical protein
MTVPGLTCRAGLLDFAAKATENGCFGLDLAANETALNSMTFG